MGEVKVNLKDEIQQKLQQIAEDASIPIEGAITLILEEFVNKPGGRIYAGAYSRGLVGEHKGYRYAIQWPFKSGFAKKKGDEIAGWGQ
ncbi:MAG: hypothetical protein ACFFB3_06450 [Candidatus Hodarchaeota archaeon]